MEWFVAVVVIVALGVAAVAASGGLGEMSREPVRDVYRQDLPVDRPLAAADVNRLRFGVTLRGYAMGQVDDVLDRLAREIAERDALIAELLNQATGTRADVGLSAPAAAEVPAIATTTDAAALRGATTTDAIDAVVAPHEVTDSGVAFRHGPAVDDSGVAPDHVRDHAPLGRALGDPGPALSELEDERDGRDRPDVARAGGVGGAGR